MDLVDGTEVIVYGTEYGNMEEYGYILWIWEYGSIQICILCQYKQNFVYSIIQYTGKILYSFQNTGHEIFNIITEYRKIQLSAIA